MSVVGQARIVREMCLAQRIVCVGGLPGCGKTLFTPIIGSFRGVEIQKFNYALEYVCSLRLLGAIDESAATGMIRLLTDLDLYNLAMSREVNLRWTDLSSVFRNPGTWRYLRRLFQIGDEAAVERIQRERPMLHLTVHYALALGAPLFQALGDSLRLIEVIRHPLYMIKQWRLYVERYGTDIRDFTIWYDYEGRTVPFFAFGWEETYLRANPMDRSIYAIERLLRRSEEVLASLPTAQQANVLFIPFERFVLAPEPYLSQMSAFLGTECTPETRRQMRRQRVPRQRIADGISHHIYRYYGWQPADQRLDERGELAARRAYVAKEASAEGLEVMDRLSAEYEAARLGDLLPAH